MNKINWKDKQENAKYHKDFHKAWYEKNKEKRKAQLKEYSLNHKEDNVRRTQKYVAKHKEKVGEYNRKFSQTIEGRYRTFVYRAKHFNGTPLPYERFIELSEMPCEYCGVTGKVGIDRVDNSDGYTIENSVPACTLCNFMKKAMKVDDFLTHIKKIYKHNERNN